jgi:hypothetical protein
MNGYSYLTGPWAEWEAQVDQLLASYGAPAAVPKNVLKK